MGGVFNFPTCVSLFLQVAERKVQSLRKTDPAPEATESSTPTKPEPALPMPSSPQAPVPEENGVDHAEAEALRKQQVRVGGRTATGTLPNIRNRSM